MLLVSSLWLIDGLSSKKMEDLPDSHVLSTCFMKSDWLKVKYPDAGMKCKQSHVVKCSVDQQKCLVDHHPKQTLWVLRQHACMFGHVTKMPCMPMALVVQLIIELTTMQGKEEPPETDTYKAL